MLFQYIFFKNSILYRLDLCSEKLSVCCPCQNCFLFSIYFFYHFVCVFIKINAGWIMQTFHSEILTIHQKHVFRHLLKKCYIHEYKLILIYIFKRTPRKKFCKIRFLFCFQWSVSNKTLNQGSQKCGRLSNNVLKTAFLCVTLRLSNKHL